MLVSVVAMKWPSLVPCEFYCGAPVPCDPSRTNFEWRSLQAAKSHPLLGGAALLRCDLAPLQLSFRGASPRGTCFLRGHREISPGPRHTSLAATAACATVEERPFRAAFHGTK